MIEAVVARHGRLDILVNNAGYGFAGTVVDSTEEDWDRLMAVNVKGVFFGCKYAIPAMARNGGGAIVSTASAAADIGIHDRAAYVASKGAVVSLTRAMAIDHVDDGVRINAVSPGTIDSPYFTEILARPRARSFAAALRNARRWDAWATRARSRRRCSGSPATMPPSAPGRTWWSTAAGPRRAIEN